MKKFTIDTIKLSEANREISKGQVERIKLLIKKHGYIKALPIIVDEDGLIIDGQHRFLACKELNIEPTIVVEPSFDITPILNASQLKWGTKDYVKYYAVKGYEDYIILEQLCKKKNISPSIAYNIIFNKTVERQGITRNKIYEESKLKSGLMKLPDTSEKGLAKIERKVDRILNLISYLNLPRTDRLIVAISRLAKDENFVFSTMKNKIDYQRSRIYRCSTIQEYMQMLANIYNHKNSKKIVV